MDHAATEFIEALGPPADATPVAGAAIDAARGRLPAGLIDIWEQYGIGSYAGGSFWLTTPDVVDPYLDRLLGNVPDLRGRLAAYGYDALGTIALWHDEARSFTLLAPYGAFMDLTSASRAAPVPYDLADLYAAAGLEMPADAAMKFLASRNEPEDFWLTLYGLAQKDAYEVGPGEQGAASIPELRRYLGPLAPNEVYLHEDKSEEGKIAGIYAKEPLFALLSLIPEKISITHDVRVGDGKQTMVDEYLVEAEG